MKNFFSVKNLVLTCVYFTIVTATVDAPLTPSSILDRTGYRSFCLKAATDDNVFAVFRTDPVYQEGLEHVTYEQGQVCLDTIMKQTPSFLNMMHLFKSSDAIGSPAVCTYESVADIAPTTVRYIKIASDLDTLFGSLEGMNIIEIGGGYGGQCKILADLYRFKSYTIVDLEEPLALTQKFLNACAVSNVTLCAPEQYPAHKSCDLVISNYAFSECSLAIQKKYIDEIMKHAKRGYLICNVLPQPHIAIPFQHEVLQMLTQANISYKVLPEVPLTNWNNYVVVWDHTCS